MKSISKKQKSIEKLLRSIMLFLMMGWTTMAWSQTAGEAIIYQTDFRDWQEVDTLSNDEKVTLNTTDQKSFTFTLNGVGVYPKGTNSKFPNYTGFMITAKYPGEYTKCYPTAVTSPIASITRLVLTQTATGTKRGLKVSVKGDGDTDWVVLHDEAIKTGKGEKLDLEVNRFNCQIKLENYNDPKNGRNNNAYIVDFTIYGYPYIEDVTCGKSIENADPATFPKEKAANAGSLSVTKKTSQNPSLGDNIYQKGDILTITAIPDDCYDLVGIKTSDGSVHPSPYDYTVTNGNNTLEAVFKRKTLHKVTVKAGNITLGSVALSPTYPNFYSEVRTSEKADAKLTDVIEAECWYPEGLDVIASADATADYIVEKWTDEAGNTLATKDDYPFTMSSEDLTLVAHYKMGYTGNVIFDISDAHVNGKTEAAEHQNAVSIQPESLEGVRSFTVPTNFTFFKSIDDNGNAEENYYSLVYWAQKDDPTQQYELGTTHSFHQENQTITLVPVFKKNPATQNNRTNTPIIRYDFGRKLQDYDDPNTHMTRHVCAQPVNIGNNENVYWTAKTYVDVLEGTQIVSHWRDVALWCNTGDKGYIRNTDYDDWCAFGPGTTFWITSCVGAKFSILTYSPITTTTIDGVVPTLDQALTDSVRLATGNKRQYVYSYTTQHSSDRIPIIIGDDYSFYKWITVQTLAANWVDFHAESNDEARGIIQEIEPSEIDHEHRDLENGDHSFHKGERVKVTFYRKKGYKLKQIVGLKKETEAGDHLPLLTLNDDGTATMIDFDFTTYKKVSRNADGSWGTLSGDGKTVWMLKATDEKTYNSEDSIRTKYELEFDITAHRSIQLQFEEKPETYYITYNSGDFASGTSPDAEWVEEGDLFLIPRNQTLYYEGNTLDHWVNEAGQEYTIGERYPATADDLRMFPVFKPNTFNILDLQSSATAVWNFAKDDDAPTINYEKTDGILVTQLEYEGKKIDLKIDLDGNEGKFNNTNTDHPERIQVNKGSIIHFPSTPQCQVILKTTEKNKSVKIAGQDIAVSEHNPGAGKATETWASATCSGEKAYQEIEYTEGLYSVSLTVTYQKQTVNQPVIESLTCNGKTYDAQEIAEQMGADDSGHITFTASPWQNDKEEMPKVTGTATNGGTVTATEATIFTKACAVTVRNANGVIVKTYPVEFEIEEPTDYPVFQELIVNGKSYTDTSNEIYDVPQSGVVRVRFNRTMKAVDVDWKGITHSAKTGKEQVFKYWDMPDKEVVTLQFTPADKIFTDIYGKTCQQTLTLILHIKQKEDLYHHHKFDFIVGQDGDIDEAIRAANGEAEGKAYNNNKTDHRYFVFVPDGEYELQGNSTISFNVSDPKDAPVDETGTPRNDMNGQNNHMTNILKPNISLIGQSKDGVTIWNHPVVEGIAYTATLDINKEATDFYAQDLTLENRFNYWGSMSGQESSGAGRAAAFVDRANRTTLKNVGMWSWQDTYYSANGADDYRGYMEDCDLAGVVDWVCGSGDIWFEHCNLVVRDRTGNNLAAPHTEVGQDWGYVFSNCNIKPETDSPTKLKGKDWTLARPWGSSPACTFLNTRMYTQPRNYGWGRMKTDLVLRFHEYKTMDGNGNQTSLSTRTLTACSPAPGSDECILTDASDYTIRNVVGGTDAYEPHRLCQQINAKISVTTSDEDTRTTASVEGVSPITWDANLEMNDDVLQWNTVEQALCYFVFKLNEKTNCWKYVDNTTEGSLNLYNYGSGYYYVRAANQQGGLGTPTDPIQYIVSDPYELEIKQVGDVAGYGWTTLCLPFNAKKPDDVTVYAATAHNSSSATDLVTDFKMTLSEVSVVDSLKGYIVYGPVGIHTFHPTSKTCDKPTILSGNPSSESVSSANINCYVLANKTWGLGFYKFAGSYLAANRAWLPENMVGADSQQLLASGKKAISLVFASNATPVRLPTYQGNETDTSSENEYYNLSGQRIHKPSQPGIYIIRGKGKFVKK